jgi:hypothetical protein
VKYDRNRVLKAVRAFESYLSNNHAFIPNYGERYRKGKIISTGFTESAVNQVVSKRGAHLLFQVLSQILNGGWRLTLSQWYPGMQATPEMEAA